MVETLALLLVAGGSLATSLEMPATAPAPQVRELRVGPIEETKTGMELVFIGPAAPCGERLKGTISLVGSKRAPVDALVTPDPEEGCSARVATSTENIDVELKNPLAFQKPF